MASSVWRDAEFDRLFQRLAEDFNRTRPIVALPPEILVLIFTSLQLSAPSYRKKSRTVLGWVRITHVCRRWREVAISSAILWTHISDLGDNWTRVFVERARNALLCISQHKASSEAILAPENIANNLYRIRVLDISGAHSSMLSLVDRLHNAAPRLEDLAVDISTDDYDSLINRIPKVSGYLLNGSNDSLRSLHLKNIFVQWDALSFPNLVFLHLENMQPRYLFTNGEERCLPSLSNLFLALARMVRLQELRLYGAVHVLPGEEQLLEPVSLPQLRSLRLNQSMAECISILRGISLQPGTNLNINCNDETAPAWETDKAVYTLLDITRNHCIATDVLNPTPHLRCALIQSSPTTAHLPLIIHDRARPHRDPKDLVDLLLPREYPDDFVGILKAMLRMLPHARLRELEVGNRLGLTAGQWAEIFAFADVRWPHLDALLVESDPACAFLDALLKANVGAVPGLQTLVIDAEPEGLDATALDMVARNVLLARNRGVPLRRIVLRMAECRPDVGVWKETLAAVVPEFEYQSRAGRRMGIDGRDSPYFSEDEDEGDEGEDDGEDEDEDMDEDGDEEDGDTDDLEDNERAFYAL
ncbi:hypothetical protein DENSPDRAFT_261064 [Dentipellis sp. KUC8613]|nr:hypothetical protein DENSPDRAFT_261064 [Dentipellis sp. KUC8613]